MPRSNEDYHRKGPPLFWWLLANILAIAFAITAWVVCLNLFRDPTNPTSYELMLKVGQIEPLEAFTEKTVPTPSRVNSPQKLETQFKGYSISDLEILNRELRRSYLTNYDKAKYLTFVEGKFRILAARTLEKDDFLSPGVVVKAQALVRPDAVADPIPYPVFIEILFPTAEDALESFVVGETLTLARKPDSAAILNVGTTEFEDRSVLFLTLVPLLSANYKTENGAPFTIHPPEKANVEAAFPSFP